TAVLALLADHVYSIDRYRTLVEYAEQRLAALGITNVTVTLGDGYYGLPDEAPFDRIMVTAASAEIPAALEEQLAIGGVMVIPVGPEGGVQTLYRVVRDEEGISRTRLIDVRFVPLVHGTAQHL
ncbi:MAG: protein-L-isoaspartate O-methyltransferase, partial [Hyphomicrobiales bacterium]|nr:protein-L-isoaspartate O-methyltransferase [Hyphomicrobiales bacterium]